MPITTYLIRYLEHSRYTTTWHTTSTKYEEGNVGTAEGKRLAAISNSGLPVCRTSDSAQR